MQRFFVFLLLMFLGSTHTVSARTCSLVDVLSGSNCLGSDSVDYCSYKRTVPCGTAGYIEYTCEKSGITYYECHCNKSGNVIEDISRNGNTKFICSVDYDKECGCPKEKVRCNPRLYPYLEKDAEHFKGAKPEGVCNDTEGDHYMRYVCDEDTYPYECSSSGFRGDDNSKCSASDGSKHYQACYCKSGWDTSECASRSDACTDMKEHQTEGSLTCYRCGPEACTDRSKLNLATYWCNSFSVASTFNVNCASLGYSQMSKDTCANGTKAVSCPFDSSYKYCAG